MPFEKVVGWQHPTCLPHGNKITKHSEMSSCRLGKKNPGENKLIIILPFLFITQKSLGLLREDRRNYATASIEFFEERLLEEFPSFCCRIYPPLIALQLRRRRRTFFKKFVFPTTSAKKTGYYTEAWKDKSTPNISLVIQQRWARHHNSNLVSHMKKLS